LEFVRLFRLNAVRAERQDEEKDDKEGEELDGQCEFRYQKLSEVDH
jgi:hypothetical protein